ncbi:MAG: superoxide dismutase [Candidatus Taylorbacteria bacterium]|nr:superoxide dismutase [Candidatus Taylorbacteria bacterium]
MQFTEQKFNIGQLEGISAKTIEEHLKLYTGYVKHANLIHEKIQELLNLDPEKHAYPIAEMQRRFAFEFDGMRNHELYFTQFEGGAKPAESLVELKKKIESKWGSFETWFSKFSSLAMTRGVGWAILYFDKKTNQLVHTWIEEQHIGHLTGLDVILALDMWEHSYMLDYVPSEKKKYIEAFFKNLNWEVVEKRFSDIVSR